MFSPHARCMRLLTCYYVCCRRYRRRPCPAAARIFAFSVRSLATTVADRAVADTKLLAATLPPAAAATAMALALLTTVTAADVARAEFPDTPPPTIFFDEANVVPAASETQIVKSLNKLAESSGLTVRFVMVRSVPYDTLPQEYADQLFQDWGLGDKDVLFVGGSKVARGGTYSAFECLDVARAAGTRCQRN